MIRGWLDSAIAFMAGLSRLLRYVLLTVLVVIALVFSVGRAISGEVDSIGGLIGDLPIVGGPKDDPPPQAPLFNFEIKPERKICPSGSLQRSVLRQSISARPS